MKRQGGQVETSQRLRAFSHHVNAASGDEKVKKILILEKRIANEMRNEMSSEKRKVSVASA